MRQGHIPLWIVTQVTRFTPSGGGVQHDRPAARGSRRGLAAPARRPRYASPDGLGQAFNLHLRQKNPLGRARRQIIADNLARTTCRVPTWVLSNDDVARHPAADNGLPGGRRAEQQRQTLQDGKVLVGRATRRAELERDLGLDGLRRPPCRALALPGSA